MQHPALAMSFLQDRYSTILESINRVVENATLSFTKDEVLDKVVKSAEEWNEVDKAMFDIAWYYYRHNFLAFSYSVTGDTRYVLKRRFNS